MIPEAETQLVNFWTELSNTRDKQLLAVHNPLFTTSPVKAAQDLAAFGTCILVTPDEHITQPKEITMSNTPLNILIVGKDAAKIMDSVYVKSLIDEGDTVVLGDELADIVIGTTAVRTYHNTTQFLKGIVKKIREEKATGSMAVEPISKPKKKKESPKKKKVESVAIEAANAIEINDKDEE